MPLSITDDEITGWRADTPGCASRVHLNNAGASLMPAPVSAAIHAHLEIESQIGGYEAAAAAAPAIESTYESLATLVGSRARNIAIVSSATAAFAQALSAFDWSRGDTIVTTESDYISNQLMFLSLAHRAGVTVRRAADAPEGGVDPESLRRLVVAHRPRLVALTWIPTNSGLVQPAAIVGEICAQLGVPFLLDACQAVGQLPVDVGRLHCDYLATTARKFLRGPRGIGFLYVSDAALAAGAHPLLVDMRGAAWTAADSFELADGARRFEQWEFPHALVLGMGAAARYALDAGVARTAARAHALAAEARRRIARVPGFRSLDVGADLSALATFTSATHAAPGLMHALRLRGINTTAQGRGDAVIDLDRKKAATVLRVSPHYFNTLDELDTIEGALRELVAAAR